MITNKLSSYLSPILWLFAFLCALFFFNDIQLELFGAAAVTLFIWSTFSLSREDNWPLEIPKSFTLYIMAAFWLLAFLSVLHSQILFVSLMAFCFFTVMPLTFFVLVLQKNQDVFDFIIRVLAFMFAGLSIWAMLQFFAFTDYFGGRAHHPLANPNSLAALFSLGFFCAVGGILKSSKPRWLVVLAALLFGGIIATASRGAFMALVPVLGIYLFVARDAVRVNKKSLGVLFVLCAVFLVAGFITAEGNNNLTARVGDTLTSTASINDISANRLSLWAAGWEMVRAHGVFGTGIGTYFLYFPEFRLADDLSGAYYAHNDPLQYWVELGVLGPVLFYAFVIAVLLRTIKAVKMTQDITQRLKILTPFFALSACILHTHVTFNLYNLSILMIVGLLLAYWFKATQAVLKTSVKTVEWPLKYAPWVRGVSIALPFVFIGALFSAYIVSEHYVGRAKDELAQGNVEAFARDVLFANKISMDGNYRAYLLAANIPMTLLQQPDAEAKGFSREDVFKQGLAYLQHVRAINPRSSSALYYLGEIQKSISDAQKPDTLKTSEEYYLEALRIDPLHLSARMALYEIYKRASEEGRALDVMEAGFDYKYNSSRALEYYGLMAQIYLMNGNNMGRDRALKKMQVFQKRLDDDAAKRVKTIGRHLWGK